MKRRTPRRNLAWRKTDKARELSAKLASLKGIEWVGVAMFLFGLASFFYPPFQVIIGSVMTSVVFLFFLPSCRSP